MKIDLKKKKVRVSQIILPVIFIFFGVILSIPFFWMIIGSFYPTSDELFMIPLRLPSQIRLENYIEAIQSIDFLSKLLNTLLIVFSTMFLNIVSSIFIAYGLARFNVKSKGFWFGVMLSTMMLPWVVTLVPSYVIYSKLGLAYTYWPLILPSVGGNVYFVFMLRQYFYGIPKALDEAATIDGCSKIGILFKILLPNTVPILITMVIFSFNGSWSDFVGPSIYILDEDKFTLSLSILFMKNLMTTGTPQWHKIMAICVVFSLPMIFIYAFLQKFFVNGVVVSGIK